MGEDFDEDTLETIESEVIGPIAEMRRKKEIQSNTFTISRENYENSTDEQVEAWFTKFDQVIIDDSQNPYKEPLNKKELALKIISKISIENLNKGIDKFNSGVDQFSKVIAANPSNTKRKIKIGMSQREYDKLFKPRKNKGNSMNFWNEDKKTRKRRNKRKPVQKEPDYSFITGKRKVKFF